MWYALVKNGEIGRFRELSGINCTPDITDSPRITETPDIYIISIVSNPGKPHESKCV